MKRNQQILESVLLSDSLAIEETLSGLDRDVFDFAVEMTAKAKGIYIIGTGNSAALAQLLAFYFQPMFEHVRLISASSANEMFELLVHMSERDVVIAFSFPRYSMRMVKALEFANERKAKIITITDKDRSPVLLYSACNLVAKSNTFTIVDSLTAALSIVNALAVALSLKKKKKAQETFDTLEELWEDYPIDE